MKKTIEKIVKILLFFGAIMIAKTIENLYSRAFVIFFLSLLFLILDFIYMYKTKEKLALDYIKSYKEINNRKQKKDVIANSILTIIFLSIICSVFIMILSFI